MVSGDGGGGDGCAFPVRVGAIGFMALTVKHSTPASTQERRQEFAVYFAAYAEWKMRDAIPGVGARSSSRPHETLEGRGLGRVIDASGRRTADMMTLLARDSIQFQVAGDTWQSRRNRSAPSDTDVVAAPITRRGGQVQRLEI